MIILERLKEVLSYDPYSGEFTWKDMHRRYKGTRRHDYVRYGGRGITKMPPYDGAWHGGQLWHWGGSTPVVVSHLDGSLGRVGHTSTCINLDSDDNDGFLIEWECTLGFWKNIPTTGKWDVWIKAKCNKASSSYTYYNEWGESWVSSSMDAHLTFGADTWTGINLANHVPFSAGMFWNSYSNGDWDGTHVFSKDWRTPGQSYWFHRPTFSTTSAKNGTFISVGTHDDVNSTINDMSTSLVMQNNWTIEKVSIDIKP